MDQANFAVEYKLNQRYGFGLILDESDTNVFDQTGFAALLPVTFSKLSHLRSVVLAGTPLQDRISAFLASASPSGGHYAIPSSTAISSSVNYTSSTPIAHSSSASSSGISTFASFNSVSSRFTSQSTAISSNPVIPSSTNASYSCSISSSANRSGGTTMTTGLSSGLASQKETMFTGSGEVDAATLFAFINSMTHR
ncbi:unnamed protein product [Protopolystoma xenopodis]|uniref:Uncharacterized protein n=1 Tax=Protopolystoma xenopodis TaxID=117903 RepID=A0A448WI23_9PLAT|nr:unnamed protein product [Protopolystoma xenopodis]